MDFIDFTPSKEPEFIVEISMAKIFDEICLESLVPLNTLAPHC